MTFRDAGTLPRHKTSSLISETTTGAGTTDVLCSIEDDSVVLSLWVSFITGTLDVDVYTLTETGKEVLVHSFDQISVATSDLVFGRPAAHVHQRLRVEITYTGICSYEIRGKPISGGPTLLQGATDGQIIGNVEDQLKVFTKIDGAISTSPLQFFLGVQRGVYEGYFPFSNFGINSSLSNSGFEPIWIASEVYTVETSAATLSISSSSANDTAAGTGARQVRITGLDSSYNILTETIALNGTTSVITTNSFLRVNDVIVVSAGSSRTNEGTITFLNSGNISAEMAPNTSNLQRLIYTVPANHTLYLFEALIQIGNGKSTITRARIVDPVVGVGVVPIELEHTESIELPLTPLYKITEKQTLIVEAQASTGSHRISGIINGILVDESLATL